ncbi:prolyl 4-hydroxylase [Paenibacillus sp. J31TS4]|uniref:2OG-Fe(II) oxygenase n=1 Tax=Paenibacillus sp. J31TS4 TaxID=2807195 RepID=UPI001AFDBECB|nr:2OG-Fe(II) oxygenase [Paenibacillus sp. J31TS4]GIP38535.1 prolyl 4-hydroxylase [Paenibacillus sp. J31TS4]
MAESLAARIAALDWHALHRSLEEDGFAPLPPLLSAEECRELRDGYEVDELFRATIDMARYRFGEGRYRYYRQPLPETIRELRESFYSELAGTANLWRERLGQEPIYPPVLSEFLAECHASGQSRPTPLLLKYEAGGYNCLHQDLYGELAFPFQVVFVLSERERDYTGGEFLLVEQRPRAQSRGRALTLEQGAGLIFPTNHRPVKGTRGYYRTRVKHGVSTVTAGTRYSLGILFHDAT